MDISLAQGHAYYFAPQIALDAARDRIEKKKTTLVAAESRLEQYWMVVDRGKK